MKKEDVMGLLVYIVIFIFAVIFGVIVLREHAGRSGLAGWQYFLYILGAIVAGVVLNSLLFETGHALGAKIGGYTVFSFNVIGFCFYKSENKTKFKFSSFDGLAGETKIVPNEKAKRKPNPLPYCWFGTLILLVLFLAEVIVFSIFKDSVTLMNFAYFLLIVGVIGVMILFYNILPLRLDTLTDGYRLRLISNVKNREAYNELLRVEYAISHGEKNVEVKTFAEITNFTAELNLNKVYVLFDQGKYEEALPLISDIINAKTDVSEKTYIRAKAQEIYIKLMTLSLEEAQEYYDKNVSMDERRIISNDISMTSIRAYILMSGLLDKSRSECLNTVNKVLKAFKHTEKKRQPIELALYNNALKKVIEAHSAWELDGYLLKESK